MAVTTCVGVGQIESQLQRADFDSCSHPILSPPSQAFLIGKGRDGRRRPTRTGNHESEIC